MAQVHPAPDRLAVHRESLVEAATAAKGVGKIAPAGKHKPFITQLHEPLDRGAESGDRVVRASLAPERATLRHRYRPDRVRAAGPVGCRHAALEQGRPDRRVERPQAGAREPGGQRHHPPLSASLRLVSGLLEDPAHIGPAGTAPSREHRCDGKSAEGIQPCRDVAAGVAECQGLLRPGDGRQGAIRHRPQPGSLAHQSRCQRLVGRIRIRPADHPRPGDLDRRDQTSIVVLRDHARRPVAEQRGRHPDRGPGRRLETPLKRGAEVVELVVETVEPVDHRRTTQRVLGLGGKRRVDGQVSVRHRRRLVGFDQLLAGVLADRLEHPVAGRGAAIRKHERAIHEAGQAVREVDRIDLPVVVADDPGSHGHRPPAREHGQAPQQPAVLVREQVPAPVDQRVQRLLARDRGPAATGQEPEPVTEPEGDVLGRHRRHPGRGQLDRERDAVEPATDLRDRRDVRGVEHERWIGAGRALGEQPDGLGR